MASGRRFRVVGSIVLSSALFAGLPALALAGQGGADPAYVSHQISGTVTGPGTANPLAGITVRAVARDNAPYYEQATTAADGAYSLTVTYHDTYDMFYFDNAGFYASCASPLVSPAVAGCTGTAVMVGYEVTGIDAQLGVNVGDTLVVSPADTTVTAGTSAPFTAALTPGVLLDVRPNVGQAPPLDVTAHVTFNISTTGSCTGASCTPPTAGDYTVTASYGGLTSAAVTVHATAPAATPTPVPTDPPAATRTPVPTDPPAAPAPTVQVTLPPTSSGGSNGSSGGSPLAWLIAASAAAALMFVGLRRPLRR